MAKTVRKRLIFIDDLEVWVLEKRVRNVAVRVKPPDGRIEVTAPLFTSDRFITEFVRERRSWIDRSVARISASPMSQAENATQEQVAEWRAVVEACVPALIAEWEPILGVKASKLAYRNMKSRWGSCQPTTGRICINVRLALYPPECLEYVVVHELCHLLVSGHGQEFYGIMDCVMPDWKQRRAKLK